MKFIEVSIVQKFMNLFLHCLIWVTQLESVILKFCLIDELIRNMDTYVIFSGNQLYVECNQLQARAFQEISRI